MKQKFSLKSVWYGLICLTTLLPIMFLLPWVGLKAHSVLLENALLRETDLNIRISDNVEHEVRRLITLLQNKSDQIAFSLARDDSQASLNNMLVNIMNREISINALYVLKPDNLILAGLVRSKSGEYYDAGNTWSSKSINHEADVRQLDIVIPMEGRNYIGPSHIHHDKPYFHISVPVGSRKSPNAILLAELDSELIWHSLIPQLSRPDVVAYLIDQRGNLLISPAKTNYKTGDLLTEFKIVRSIIAHKDWIQKEVYKGLRGISVFGTATKIDLLNWGVISEIPEKNITWPIIQSLSGMAVTIVGVITLFGVVGLWFVRRVTKPVTELLRIFNQVSKGDYSKHLEPSLVTEFNEIVKGCNKMVSDINKKEQRHAELISILEESNSDLEASEEKLQETLKRMDIAYKQAIIFARELKKEVSERKKSEEAAKHMAYHDQLTGLPNRLLLTDRLDHMLAEGVRYKRLGAVIFLDLDNFKVINDTLGHAEGDELLKVVAERLKKHVRHSDTLARHGGDEFALVVQDLKKVENISKVIDGIFSEFDEPFYLRGQEFFVTTSIGISVYPNDGTDADTLLKNADIAMYKAKEKGKNTYQLFDAAMNEKALERVVLEGKLRKAIENDEFLLDFQPQIDLTTGKTVSLETLVRWNDKEIEIIPPNQFIPLAEDTGLIVPIGNWVLYNACKQNKYWQDKGLKPIVIAVNVSPRQFKQKDFVNSVRRILEHTKIRPQFLELEITESSLMDDVISNIAILKGLKSLGIKLSIDDFGTGYSSFEYLKQLPIDSIKIDLTFIRDITDNPDDAAIVKAIIQVANILKLDVVAEGVETVEQLSLLESLGCNKIQGYLISRPMAPSDELERFLRKEWRLIVNEKGKEKLHQRNISL